MLRVYLAGPMEHCDGTLWRNELKVAINDIRRGFLVMDPCTRTDAHELIESGEATFDIHNYVFECDLYDVKSADIIVANVTRSLGAGRGTNFELGYGYARGKKIILIESVDCHPHPFYESISSQPGNVRVRSVHGAAHELRRVHGLSGHPYAKINK